MCQPKPGNLFCRHATSCNIWKCFSFAILRQARLFDAAGQLLRIFAGRGTCVEAGKSASLIKSVGSHFAELDWIFSH